MSACIDRINTKVTEAGVGIFNIAMVAFCGKPATHCETSMLMTLFGSKKQKAPNFMIS